MSEWGRRRRPTRTSCQEPAPATMSGPSTAECSRREVLRRGRGASRLATVTPPLAPAGRPHSSGSMSRKRHMPITSGGEARSPCTVGQKESHEAPVPFSSNYRYFPEQQCALTKAAPRFLESDLTTSMPTKGAWRCPPLWTTEEEASAGKH